MYLIKEKEIKFDLLKSTDSRFPIDELKSVYDWKIEYMTPDKFLFLSDSERYTIDYKKVDSYIKRLQTNSKVPVPILIFGNGKQNKTTFHDGQHRVLALQKFGINKIPVLCFYEER